MNYILMKWAIGGFLCLIQFFSLSTPVSAQMIFCGKASSDLYKVLIRNDFKVKRYDSPSVAITSAPDAAVIFIIANGYPKIKNEIAPELLQLARKKNLRLYIEYPVKLPGLSISDTVIEARLERGIIVSDDFDKDLEPMSILGINDCHIIPAKVDSPLIVLGNVAGFDKAVYGVKDVKTYPGTPAIKQRLVFL
ncbi:MAG: hypothetical protein EPN37_12415 [Chitinophagaceae bacterium]|nr:MAG: hypothetical protein EPN37_12415 [Chitinophagaceae bacterium]